MSADSDPVVAAVFRAALTLGIATSVDLVLWADVRVLARDPVPAWIIDLSLGALVSPDQAVANLADLPTPTDGDGVRRCMIGLIDQPDYWTFATAGRLAEGLRRMAGVCGKTGRAGSQIDQLHTHFVIADTMHYPDRLIVDAVGLLRAHANPAARAWLPTVRVRIGDD